MNHYDVKIGFTNPISGKHDNESIIVYAENLIDIEEKVTSSYGTSYHDLEVEKVSVIKNTEFQFDNYDTDKDKLFKVKVGMTTVDEKTGKEKVLSITRMFNDEDFDTALKKVKGSLTTEEFVVSLIETNYTNVVVDDKG